MNTYIKININVYSLHHANKVLQEVETYKTGTLFTDHWRIQDFRLGARSSAEDVSIEAPQAPRGWGLVRGENFWIFFCLGMVLYYILRAF